MDRPDISHPTDIPPDRTGSLQPKRRSQSRSRGAGRGRRKTTSYDTPVSAHTSYGTAESQNRSSTNDSSNLESSSDPRPNLQHDHNGYVDKTFRRDNRSGNRRGSSRGRFSNRNQYRQDRLPFEPQPSNESQPSNEPQSQESQTGRRVLDSRRSRGRGGFNRSFARVDTYSENSIPELSTGEANQQNSDRASSTILPLQPIDESNVQSEISESQLKTNTFECMICCDNITRFHPIWYCSSCYNIFHLKCAIEWCNKSIKSRNEAIASSQYPSLSLLSGANRPNELMHEQANYQQERVDSIEWPCPACREVLHTKPSKYKCFCGKVIRPDVNKYLTPHSCGQLCGKKRPNSDCPHLCNSICHPGKCNSCPLTSKKLCFCGKVARDLKCSIGIISCDKECGKLLSCGQHHCGKICHEGNCQPCNEVITISCRCGNDKTLKKCEEHYKEGKKAPSDFTCDKVCGKLLNCGKHNCTDKCHSKCKGCKLLSDNIKTCPCGTTTINKSLLSERKSCTDPVPTCQGKCNRALPCGPEKNRHKCQKKCHSGPCPPCKLKMMAYCGCKLSTKTIDCNLMYERVVEGNQVYYTQVDFSFKCELRCNKPKNCGRHRCNNKCCDYNKTKNQQLHQCDQICNRKLPCGEHNCPERCHPAQCGDCTNIGWTELTCHCGASIKYPPIPCGARPPTCRRPCSRAHNCGHQVKHECHDDLEKCAPCTVFVKKPCFCGIDSKDSVYCYLPGYSCGRTCKKQLNCGQHVCQKVCHDGPCEIPSERGVILCNKPCPVPRYLCKHPCGITCHGRTPCPSSPCRRAIEVSCACGNRTDRIECHKSTKYSDNQNKVAMISTNRSNQESVIIDLSKKSSVSTEDDSSNNQLDCDETCATFKRNKALAEALDIAQPDLKPAAIFGEDPLRLLKEATAHDYKFVSATYNSLTKLIKSARESDKRFIFMAFPPAEKLRREVVKELAYHFNCTSESKDDEPFRHVVVRAYKNKSNVPEFSIEQLLPVSD